MEQEGVIKFSLSHAQRDCNIDSAALSDINEARRLLLDQNMIGQDPTRYDGYGFGNISRAIDCDHQANPNPQFWISGSQTGHLKSLKAKDIARVDNSDIELNALSAYGLTVPSSESLSHAALYKVTPQIRAVVHVHCPIIWRYAKDRGLPATAAEIPYGTPDMAKSISRIAGELIETHQPCLFAMLGHEDGVIVADRNLSVCAKALSDLQTKALEFYSDV